MNSTSTHLAIIGSGASCIYLLKNILNEAATLRNHIREISIFEKCSLTGMGMPYNPHTTDRYNMSNISSEELPELMQPFADWLRSQPVEVLKELDLATVQISDSEVYSRLALGKYLHSQYQQIIHELTAAGFILHEQSGCKIVDVEDQPAKDCVLLTSDEGETFEVHRLVIATGHYWTEDDRPEDGYFASPWPISKLLPKEGGHHNFLIGTLGASLSAFDVIASLSHRHGEFRTLDSGRMTYFPHPGTENFHIVMHSAHGLLPHLQFDQVEPFREIYRHVNRDGMLALRDSNGLLRIETFFDKVCRPVLIEAFKLDEMSNMATMLESSEFTLVDFVEKMTGEHDYHDAFEGMRIEMVEARESVLNHKPIHWKEAIDDLMYTLNFHAEMMPAEDHLILQSKVMPFLMNVIAAMPLPSGNTILALHDAGKLSMTSGRAGISEVQAAEGMTTVEVDNDGKKSTTDYRMFIDCSGQKPLELEDYPFPSLLKHGSIRKARATFENRNEGPQSVPKERQEKLIQDQGEQVYAIGGVDIDGTFRLIGNDGASNPRIHDIAFPHTTGVRPYSYGLQACNDTSAILVKSWVDEISAGAPIENDPVELTQIYESVSD